MTRRELFRRMLVAPLAAVLLKYPRLPAPPRLIFWISETPTYSFGFSGFTTDITQRKVQGQIRFVGNVRHAVTRPVKGIE